MEMNLRNYAYIGDAVWELFVREKTIYQTQNANELHKISTSWVNAGFQNELMLKLQNELSEEEQDILRRSRNLPVPTARRSNQSEYRMATGFEALIGWWHLNNRERLDEILKKIEEFL